MPSTVGLGVIFLQVMQQVMTSRLGLSSDANPNAEVAQIGPTPTG